MTTTQAVLITAAVVGFAAIGTGVYETQRVSGLQQELSALRQEQASLAKESQQLRQERDDARRQLAALQQEDEQQRADHAESAKSPASPLTSTSPASAPSAESGARTTTNAFAGLASMLKDPQMKEMVRAQQKMMVEQMYGSLYKKLGLSPADEDSLKKLLEDRQMALTDAGLAAMSGSGTDMKQVGEQTKDIKAQYDKQIQDLLGPQGYSAFQQYDQTVAERTQVNLFKQNLSADNALTEQQENDLVDAMYQARKALPENSLLNSKTRDPLQFTDDAIAEAMKQQEQLQKQYAESASSILTPAQLDQFTKFQQQMATMQAAGMKMAQQMFGQNKSGAAAPAPSSGSTP
ncbi:MAG TPA: hypothetical protein VMV72_01310 [Verrucomicrobiae bacterium]|nr:hypothetical protein [Verrucomicrobiae bacterium]